MSNAYTCANCGSERRQLHYYGEDNFNDCFVQCECMNCGFEWFVVSGPDECWTDTVYWVETPDPPAAPSDPRNTP